MIHSGRAPDNAKCHFSTHDQRGYELPLAWSENLVDGYHSARPYRKHNNIQVSVFLFWRGGAFLL
jgi:hypothetical protein